MAMQRRLALLCLATGILLQLSTFTLSQGVCNDESIRLVGGPNEFEGRIEICLGGVWGQVCGTGWDDDSKIFPATVVCRNLGHITGTGSKLFGWPRNGNIYGKGDGPAFIDNITSCGNPNIENHLINCVYTSINITSGCPNNITAGVVCPDTQCQKEVVTSNGGRLEVCLKVGRTRTFVRAGVCSQNWDNSDARVLCKQLWNDSSEDAARATLGPKSNYGFILNSSIDCLGNETDFIDCFSPTMSTLQLSEHSIEEDGCVLAEVQCQSGVESTTTVSSMISTTQLEATPNTTNYTLIAIGVGIVAFLVIIIVAILLVLLICIVVRKHMRKTYSMPEGQNTERYFNSSNDRPDSCDYDDTLPVGITALKNDLPVTGSSKLTENSSYEEPEKILLNPLYRKTTVPGYAKILTREGPSYYATPVPPPPPVAVSIRQANGVVIKSKPIIDTQGYASLETPYSQPFPRPYEIPISPPSSVHVTNNSSFKSDCQPPHVYEKVP